MPNNLKAILFDVFGTVVDWRSSIAREVEAVSQLNQVDGELFADRWRSKYQPSMERIRSGNRPFVKLDDLHYENLNEVLVDFGVDALDETIKQHLNRAWHRLNPWADSVEGLRRLKTIYIIATLSNGNVALSVNMARNAGLPWDMVLGAEVVGHYKPQPESYLKSAAMLGLEPGQCMLVAAHNSDLIAAAKCGYNTAFVPRPTEYGPNQTTDLEPTAQYTVVATDFIDLAAQLGC
ncbi:MAG: haloacid dehalogenase type II [Gammaproteobacteria bacterium]|nr:haloacid dehalogenase type II [Gammaproteobacteria bacterium]